MTTRHRQTPPPAPAPGLSLLEQLARDEEFKGQINDARAWAKVAIFAAALSWICTLAILAGAIWGA